jgi:hypothetical protein
MLTAIMCMKARHVYSAKIAEYRLTVFQQTRDPGGDIEHAGVMNSVLKADSCTLEANVQAGDKEYPLQADNAP